MKQVRYGVNGGAEVVVTGSSATVTLSAEGANTVSAYAVDAAGLLGAPRLTSVAIDTIAPAVVTTSPANKATGVLKAASIVLTFGENVAKGSAYAGDRPEEGDETLTVKPSQSLAANAVHTLTVPASGIVDLAGNTNPAYEVTFTTGTK